MPSFMDELIADATKKAGEYGDALQSGALNTAAGYTGALGSLDRAKQLESQGAALAPQTPDLLDLLASGKYGEAGDAAGKAFAQSIPQMGATIGGGFAGAAAGTAVFPGVGTAVGALLGATAASAPQFYGQNLLGQSRVKGTTDLNKLDRGRAATIAVGQGALDSLVTILFPALKVGPGAAKTVLGRLGKGTIYGAVEEAPVEALQEAGSIINENPEFKALFDPESLKRISTAFQYGAAIGAPVGAAGQTFTSTPSLNRLGEDVAREMEARRYFTPKALKETPEGIVVWGNPNEIGSATKLPKVERFRSQIYNNVPSVDIDADGKVTKAYGVDAIEYLRQRKVGQVPIRINLPEGSKVPDKIKWGRTWISLGLEGRKGTGSATNPIEVTSAEDMTRARKVASRRPRHPGYINAFGMDIAIQTPMGNVRKGTDRDGNAWTTLAPADYGEIRKSKNADGAPLDVWIGPNIESNNAFVIEQVDPESGLFDEHKAMLGFNTAKEAIEAYDKSFGKGDGALRRGEIHNMPVHKLRAWAKNGDPTKRLSENIDDMPVTPEDVHEAADRLGVQWDNNGNFMKMTERAVGKRHLDQMSEQQLRKIKGMLDAVEMSGGSAESVTAPAQISFEATPSTSLDWHFMNNLPKGDINGAGAKWDWQRTVDNIMRNKDGSDRVAKVLGLADLFHMEGTGWWKGDTNPVTQSQIISGLGHHVQSRPILLRYPDGESLSVNIPQLTPQARQLMSAYAAAKGLASKQDGVGWHFSMPTTKSAANGIDVEIGEPLGEADTKKVMAALKKADLDMDIVPVTLPTGVRLFHEGAGGQQEIHHDPNWATDATEVVRKALKDRNPDIDYNWTESHVVEQDWENDETGSGYIKQFNQVASPSARAELGRILDEIDHLETIRIEDGSTSRNATKRFNRGIREELAGNADIGGGILPFDVSGHAKLKETSSPVSLGGLEVSPVGQRQIYDLFGSISADLNSGEETDTTKEFMLYDLENGVLNKPWRLGKLLDEFGFRVRYFSFEENPEKGVKWRTPDLKRDSYDNGTLWVYNPNNIHGAFDGAPDYTNAWRITHELSHALTERVVQRKYGSSKREGRLGRVSTGYRGVPGKQVEIELRPLTLKEAQRAVEWEDITFRMQRQVLERMGVKISDADFNKEYNVNMADAVYRILSGDFGDPGKRGFRPHDTIADVSGALKLLEEAETKMAADQGRPKTKGIDLGKWRQVREDEIAEMMQKGLANRGTGRAAQSEKIGLRSEGGENKLLDSVYAPLARAVEQASLKEGTPEQWSQNILASGPRQKYGIKDNELRFTKFEPWLKGQDPNRKLTKAEVLSAVMDREPEIEEIYFGTKPPPIIGQKAAGGESAVAETKVLEFDEDNPSSYGEIDRASRQYERAYVNAQEQYTSDNFNDELDNLWSEVDPSDLWAVATDEADYEKGYDIANRNMPESGDYDWAVVKNTRKLSALGHLVNDIPEAFAGFSRLFHDGMSIEWQKSRVNEARDFVRKALTEEFRRVTAADGAYGNGDFYTLHRAFEGEHAASIIENDQDSLRQVWEDSDRVREQVYDRLNESFGESGWDSDIEPRIWLVRADDAEGNDIAWEIREKGLRGSGKYTIFIDDEELDDFNDFQAAVDALQGRYAEMSGGVVDATPAAGMPRNSVYQGASRWGHYNIQAGPNGRNYRELVTRVKNLPGPYQHGHYSGIGNPVIHVRTQDIDVGGGRSLFMRERQSDQYSAGARGDNPPGFYEDKAEEDVLRVKAMDEQDKAHQKRGVLSQEMRDIKFDVAATIIPKSRDLADAVREYINKSPPNKRVERREMAADIFNADPNDQDVVERNLLMGSKLFSAAEDERVGSIPGRNILADIGKLAVGRFRIIDIALDQNVYEDIGTGIYNQFKPMILEESAKYGKVREKFDAIKDDSGYRDGKVPASPWQKQWDEYLLRRMLMWSAERGYDSISWPTGNMLGLIEGWGSGQTVINRNLGARAAIRDRNDVGAVNYLSALGKKYGSKPKLVNIANGKEADIKMEAVQFLPDGNGVVYGDDLKPLTLHQGEKDHIKKQAMRAWGKENKLENRADIERYLKNHADADKLSVANALKQLESMDDADLLGVAYDTAVLKGESRPFKFQMMVASGLPNGQRGSINMLGDDYIWEFDITEKMRDDLMANGVSGYWRGGLVRAA